MNNHNRLFALNAIRLYINKFKDSHPNKYYDTSLLNIDDLTYYSFPKTYGSTSGPFGGIGGAAVTTFQIEAYSDGITTVYFCGNKIIKTVTNSKICIISDI